ncbi:MAG TPA: hypothetical protein PK695_08050 [Chitinophagaceae bacterium]|nr:hypothetical protein [Chitinophagaceae bacterium]
MIKKIFITQAIFFLFFFSASVQAQDCKTNADLDATPGKYLTAAQYPWPAARAEYFNNMKTAADKAMAKKTLEQIEKTEQQSHAGFNLTGGNWENTFSTAGYQYLSNTKLGQYTFQAALYEFFCANGKAKRNSEYSTVLRIYVNQLQLTTLDRFLSGPFGSSLGSYDFGLQYADWKNHKPADVNAKLINLFTYITCNNSSLLEAINSGNGYFQDVAEKDIKPNNRSNYIYRYWFVKKNDLPVLIPVSRKEYLQSLLEYYEREKIYFQKLIAELTADRSNDIKYYSNWQADVDNKISIVNKALKENTEEWLAKQAIVNKVEDASQNYKAKLTEQTNYNRFWKFYDNENKSQPLYKYNPEYFKADAASPAKPQFISIAFRYVTIPSSLRMFNNFTKNFSFEALIKILQ